MVTVVILLSITQRGAQKEPSVLLCLSVYQSCIFVSGLLAGLLSWCWTVCLSVYHSVYLSVNLSDWLSACSADWLSDRLVCLHENFVPFLHYSGSAID